MGKKVIKDGQGFHDFKRTANPFTFHNDFARYVRSFGDIYFWPKGNFHVITRAALAKQALEDPQISCDRSSFFLSRMPNLDLNLITDFFDVVSKMMIMRDGEDHKKRRAIASFGLSSKIFESYDKKITAIVEKILSRAFKKDQVDFAQDISSKLPSLILAELFFVPEEDREEFYRHSNTMTGFFGGGSGI